MEEFPHTSLDTVDQDQGDDEALMRISRRVLLSIVTACVARQDILDLRMPDIEKMKKILAAKDPDTIQLELLQMKYDRLAQQHPFILGFEILNAEMAENLYPSVREYLSSKHGNYFKDQPSFYVEIGGESSFELHPLDSDQEKIVKKQGTPYYLAQSLSPDWVLHAPKLFENDVVIAEEVLLEAFNSHAPFLITEVHRQGEILRFKNKNGLQLCSEDNVSSQSLQRGDRLVFLPEPHVESHISGHRIHVLNGVNADELGICLDSALRRNRYMRKIVDDIRDQGLKISTNVLHFGGDYVRKPHIRRMHALRKIVDDNHFVCPRGSYLRLSVGLKNTNIDINNDTLEQCANFGHKTSFHVSLENVPDQQLLTILRSSHTCAEQLVALGDVCIGCANLHIDVSKHPQGFGDRMHAFVKTLKKVVADGAQNLAGYRMEFRGGEDSKHIPLDHEAKTIWVFDPEEPGKK